MANSKTRPNKNKLLSELAATLESEVDVPSGEYSSVGEWALSGPIILDRGAFTFERHEYLKAPYSDDHPFQVEMKSTQMGNTVRAILRCLYASLLMSIVGVLYLFPSRTGIGDFSRSRVSPLIAANPEMLGKYVKDTDSVGLKRVKNKNLIFRGTRSEEGLRSDPVDIVVYDEFDLFPDGVEGKAAKRLSHSDFKWQHYLSNPTIPDYGIDRLFQTTDQQYWMLKCPKCGEYTCLEDHVDKTGKEPPACLVYWDEVVVRLCMSCRDAVLDPACGEWVAKAPSVQDRRGRHYSQLFSSFVSPKEILDEYFESRKLNDWFNYTIGFPYIEAENRISKEQVLALCGNQGIESSDRGPCYMGVDQRSKEKHVVIGKRHPDRLVHIGKYASWEELPGLIKNFNVSCCVVDAQPEIDSVRKLANKFPGKVFLCYYSEHQKGDYVWNEGRSIVTANRTESLDQSGKDILDEILALPRRCEIVEEFATHCNNVAKRLEEKDDGSARYVYVRLGEDHFRHALNYEAMARHNAAKSFFGGSDLS